MKMGEDITETLENGAAPSGKVIQTVREKKFTCRAYEKITQPPFAIVLERMAHDGSSFHPMCPRGWAGQIYIRKERVLFSSLLAMIVFEKYGQHQPLNRQAERYAREGVDLSLSTLADQVGAVAELLKPTERPDRGTCLHRGPSCMGTTRPCRCWPAAGTKNRSALDLCAR